MRFAWFLKRGPPHKSFISQPLVKSCPGIGLQCSLHGGTHVKRAPHNEGGDGGGSTHAPDDFVAGPHGSINFGSIAPDVARAIKRQPGKIRLPRGIHNADGTGYGLAHIEAGHGKHIRGAGFASVEEFVLHVAADFGQVWQASGRQLLVAVRDGKQHMMYVQLEPATDGDYYRVNTAFPVRQADYPEKHGFHALWPLSVGSEPATAATGKRPAFASETGNSSGQSVPNARSNIGDLTIPRNLNKSMPSRLVVFMKELPMDQFDLLKSHIDAYTRKDGAVVQAHEADHGIMRFRQGKGKTPKQISIGHGKSSMFAEVHSVEGDKVLSSSAPSSVMFNRSDLNGDDAKTKEFDSIKGAYSSSGGDPQKVLAHIKKMTNLPDWTLHAHDDKRQKKQSAPTKKDLEAVSVEAEREGGRAARMSSGASPNLKFKQPANTSHSDAASFNLAAANLHEKAAAMYQSAIDAGNVSKDNDSALKFHKNQAVLHHGLHKDHLNRHQANPNGVPSRYGNQ